ncbi:MAG: DNA repair protein RecN [Actinomycetota bacterium]|nr:MAG: DNA repair protein RecN [Actinomycetota bacterium]
MLRELQVKNFAIIDDVRISLKEGLNCLTGETGAGKTLIIEAINLLIGERADSSLIRETEEKLLVQGYFDLRNNHGAREFLLSQNILEDDDFESDIVISRELNRTGKNKAFINGLYTQVSTLKKLGDYFIDLHGQHEHQYLLDPKTHIDIIDNFGKEPILLIKEKYIKYYDIYQTKSKELNELLQMQKTKEMRLQDLEYSYRELDKLNIKNNEEMELENELRILKNFENIYELASEAAETVKGSGEESSSLSDKISLLQKNISQLSEIDHNFKAYSDRISLLAGLIEEISHFISSYLTDFEFSRERLDAIQQRLFQFSEIKKKYNIDLDRSDEYIKKIKEEIDNYQSLDQDIEKASNELRSIKQVLGEAAVALSSCRDKSKARLEEKITGELKDLNFKSVSFSSHKQYIEDEEGIEVDGKLIKFNRNGIDNIEFYISLNIGEAEKPLRKVASGGEISRIMLALKSALSSADNISTMVFDEIDAGIGGTTSIIVGEKIYNISRTKQVIAITHLAQIACFSDHHYFIDKYIEDNRTKIKIKRLENNNRTREISRMLGGIGESDISVKHADELINRCNEIKRNLMEEKIEVGN